MLSTLVRSGRLKSCHGRRTFNVPAKAADYWDRIKEKEKNDFIANDLNNQIVASTERWVSEFVVKHNLCPFASKYRRSIHVINYRDNTSDETLANMIFDHGFHLLAKDQAETSTKLLIFPQKRLMGFDAFMQLAMMIQMRLFTSGISGLEVVPFHPQTRRGYTPTQLFPEKDPVHFTARTPYPTMHLFKSADSEKEARKWEENTNRTAFTTPAGKKVLMHIPQKNHETLHRLGFSTVKKQFESFYPPVSTGNGSGGCPIEKEEPTAPVAAPVRCPVATSVAPVVPVVPSTPPVTFADNPKQATKKVVRKVKTA